MSIRRKIQRLLEASKEVRQRSVAEDLSRRVIVTTRFMLLLIGIEHIYDWFMFDGVRTPSPLQHWAIEGRGRGIDQSQSGCDGNRHL
jgi:hypothetical protein